MFLFLLTITKLATDFIRFAVGTLQNPYMTYRILTQKEDVRYLPFIGGFILLYLILAGLAKGGLAAHPLLLTASFVKVVAGIALSYMYSVSITGLLGVFLGGDVRWRRFSILWAFSLLPTSLWFIATSFFSLILPPPRTMSLAGQFASGVFITLSLGLLFWKGILYYLSLRFGLRLDLGRIMVVSSIFLPLSGLYSFFLYRLGVFRVPFL